MAEDKQIQKYDRVRGGLQGVGLFTKPSTIQTVENITGRAETFVVVTARKEDLGGDFIFIEQMDESGLTRVCLPPKVANIIASQRDSLSKRRRKAAAKRRAQDMKDKGIVPGFMRNPGWKQRNKAAKKQGKE